MTVPQDSTFGTFSDGGDLSVNDIVVGLRNGINTRFNASGFPGLYLPLLGGVMAGAIDMDSNIITGLPAPTTATEAVNKAYADSLVTGEALTNVDDSNVTLTLGGTPATSLLHAVSLTLGWTGQLPVTRGGSGAASFTAYSVICGGTTSTGALQNVSGVGTANQVLVSNGAAALPSWQSVPGLVPAALTEVNDTNVTLTLGGTPATSLLQAVSLTLGWTGTLAETRGGTAQSTYALGDTLYSSAANTLSKLPGNITAVKQYLSQTGTGAVSAAPAWATIDGGDITGAALSKTDDTNVTLTLGGTPTTALLRAASMTLGWTGQLSVARGGTGLAAITAHYLPIGNGTSALTLLAPSATSGIPLISQGASADPAYGTAVVSGGGTGNTTFTAYSLIAAGTTATGAFQNVSGVGTSNQVLVSQGAGALPQWASVPGLTPAALTKTDDTNVTLTLGGTPATALLQAASLTLGWTGTLGLTRGGTAASLTASNGGIVYSTASALAILAGTATAGQMLQSGASTTPAWSTTSYPATNAINTIMYASSANVLGVITPVNSAVMISSAGGVPSFSTTLPSGLTIPGYQASITPAALTKSDDTNVTLTLGGTPATALLQAASLTLGWTGSLAVARGGSGNTTFTAYSVLCAGTTATGAFQNVSGVGTLGQVLTSNGAGALPSWSAAVGTSGRLIGVQVFTGSGTYTPTSGMATYIAEAVSAGGGTGGCTSNSVSLNATAGGGSGGYLLVKGTAADIGASQAVTIGAAGTAGTNAPTSGGTGGTTSLGSLWSIAGGVGSTSQASTSVSIIPGALGGAVTVSTGTTLKSFTGQTGGAVNQQTNIVNTLPGFGGSNPIGFGGQTLSTGANAAGQAGKGYGAGASGAQTQANGASAGGAGTVGYMIIYEFS